MMEPGAAPAGGGQRIPPLPGEAGLRNAVKLAQNA
jgi:hypothetical protein